MTRAFRAALLAAYALTLAACATTPPPAPQAPAKKCDAKTQLETGRKSC